MILECQLTLPARIEAVALAPGGGLGLAVLEGGAILRFDLSDGTLTPSGRLELPADRHQVAWSTGVRIWETRAGFLDDATILVAESAQRSTSDRSTPIAECFRTTLLALDFATGEVRGRFEDHGHGIAVGPMAIPPHNVLLGLHQKTVICLDAHDWRETCRVRELDEAIDPVGDDAFCPEEGLTAGGIAFDRASSTLHVLWGYAFGSALQSYRLDADRARFVSTWRTPEFDREPYALSLSPDGASTAALLRGDDRKIGLGEGSPTLPARSTLGLLRIESAGEDRTVDVESDTERDFACIKSFRHDPDGLNVLDGYSIHVDSSEYRPKLFQLDEKRLILNSPKGFLLEIDAETGRSQVVQDLLYPVRDMAFHPGRGLLLAGCEDRTLSLLRA